MVRWLLRLFVGCAHQWKVLDKTTVGSAYDAIMENGQTIQSVSGTGLFSKKTTVVVACGECGKLKVVRTTSSRWGD